ncbi:MAG TPA: trypsin-like peptidase domain-containing protein [Solirubrobacteraceae bacterium]|jgi:S1-C subfamily serine protease
MRQIRLPLLSGLLGGGIVAVVLLVIGVGGTDKTTTVVQQAPIAASPAASRGEGKALTPADIYRRDAPGVVFIRAQIVQRSESPFDLFPTEQRGEATGSGFVIDKSGDILTNAHVVDGAVKVTVQFSDDKTVDAKIVGRDTSTDLALLKVDSDGLSLRPLELGSAKDVQVGDPAIAIGNPFGLSRTLTTGVISAKQRQIQAPNGFRIDNVLQTDAPINPGNSGGPLLDATGRVIGINSQIETGGSGNGNVGIGFAVPIDTARHVLPQLKESGRVERAWLGVSSLTIDRSLRALDLPVDHGALVQSVQRGSPADKANIKGGDIEAQLNNGTPVQLGGDIIAKVDGKDVNTSDDLASAVENHKPGDEVTLEVLSGKSKRDAKVKLGKRPASLDQTVPSG